MLAHEDIAPFFVELPDSPTIFGSPKDFKALPPKHQDQIIFLSQTANQRLQDFVEHTGLLTGPPWNPFERSNFKETKDILLPKEEKVLKKWLYERKISFKNWVFVLPNYSKHSVYLTWKMLIKYSSTLFFADDLVIFDQSGNWCLVHFHEGYLYFGRYLAQDSEAGYQRMEELYKLRDQYPKFNHPLLPKKDT